MALVHKDVKANQGSNGFKSDGRFLKQNLSLFGNAPLPIVTLNTEQFAMPSGFAVIDTPRTSNRKVWGIDGRKVKVEDDNGNEIDELDGEDVIVNCVDADLAQTILDGGGELVGMPTIELHFDAENVAIQDFEIENIIKVKKGNVRLGWTAIMGKPSCTRPYIDVLEYDIE